MKLANGMIASWKDHHSMRSGRRDYVLYRCLTLPDGGIIATVEQFTVNPPVFYANTGYGRSGPKSSHKAAVLWVEESLKGFLAPGSKETRL